MEYGKIIAITGMAGLYEVVGSKQDGAVVRSLDDKTTKFVSSRIHNFSHLESIEVYTERENVGLIDVLISMDKSGEPLPSDKDATAVKAYFQKVYPEMDFERVYASDMKKMIKWYSVLKANNVELKPSEVEEADEESNDVSEASKVTETVIPEAEKKETDLQPVEEEVADEAPAVPKKKHPGKKIEEK